MASQNITCVSPQIFHSNREPFSPASAFFLNNLDARKYKKRCLDHSEDQDNFSARKKLRLKDAFDVKPASSSPETTIKLALEQNQDHKFIGDCSKEHCLPTVLGKHNDLKAITANTVRIQFTNLVADVIIN